MTRARLVTRLTNAVALATNQVWPDDRHGFALIRGAINRTLSKGHAVVVLTRAEADAARYSLGYVLELAGEGDNSHVRGRTATTYQSACRKMAEAAS